MIIKIEVNGKEIELSKEDAEKLYRELESIFKRDQIVYVPYYPFYPYHYWSGTSLEPYITSSELKQNID